MSRDGHRFSYHRTGSAASLIAARDARPEALAGLDVLHITGVSLSISDTAAEAALLAARCARAAGARISFVRQLSAAAAPGPRSDDGFSRGRPTSSSCRLRTHVRCSESKRIEDVAAALEHPAELVMTRGPEPALLLAGAEQHMVVRRRSSRSTRPVG